MQDITITDQNNIIIAHLYKNILPLSILQQLEQIVPQVPNNMKLNNKGTDIFPLGYYLDRVGKISNSKLNNTSIGKQIITLLQPISKVISSIILNNDNNFYQYTKKIPSKYRLFGLLTAFYCNLQPPEEIHRDEKDAKWCFIFVDSPKRKLTGTVGDAAILKRCRLFSF